MSRSTSNTKEKFWSFLYEGQRIQFSLKMNCQPHCLFLVFGCAWHTEISASIIISFFTDVSGQTCLWTSYFFLHNKNETGFQQDIKMMFKIRFFLLTFSIHFVSSFLYHNKVIDRSKLFILFQCLLSFFSVLFFLKTLNIVQNVHIANTTDRKWREGLDTINWITQRFIVDRNG